VPWKRRRKSTPEETGSGRDSVLVPGEDARAPRTTGAGKGNPNPPGRKTPSRLQSLPFA